MTLRLWVDQLDLATIDQSVAEVDGDGLHVLWIAQLLNQWVCFSLLPSSKLRPPSLTLLSWEDLIHAQRGKPSKASSISISQTLILSLQRHSTASSLKPLSRISHLLFYYGRTLTIPSLLLLDSNTRFWNSTLIALCHPLAMVIRFNKDGCQSYSCLTILEVGLRSWWGNSDLKLSDTRGSDGIRPCAHLSTSCCWSWEIKAKYHFLDLVILSDFGLITKFNSYRWGYCLY